MTSFSVDTVIKKGWNPLDSFIRAAETVFAFK